MIIQAHLSRHADFEVGLNGVNDEPLNRDMMASPAVTGYVVLINGVPVE